MKTNWFRLLLPVWDMLMTISDDGAGPDQISLNNQQLVREMENKKRRTGRPITEEELAQLRKRFRDYIERTGETDPYYKLDIDDENEKTNNEDK